MGDVLVRVAVRERLESPGQAKGHADGLGAEAPIVASYGMAPGQQPSDPRRVIAAVQNLPAIERLTRSDATHWHPRADDPLGQHLRNLAVAGLVELHPLTLPNGAKVYRPELTGLGAATVFDVIGVAKAD